MDEIVFYCCQGNSNDKRHENSFGYLSSIHSTKQYLQYRQCCCDKNGAVLTGFGSESKLIVACKDRAVINVYLYGKEGVEQRIPVPEPLSCLHICQHTTNNNRSNSWLLIGGAKSGRIFIWELSSGLLLAVKEYHLQEVSVIKSYNGYLFTAGKDSQVIVWKISDLVLDYTVKAKPFAIFNDSMLPITDLVIEPGLSGDLKLYTSSLDSTVRCYSVESKKLQTTYVLPSKIESLASDPSFRVLYTGLENGTVRVIPLYQPNSKTHILEATGGLGRIVTLKPDPELKETIMCGQEEETKKCITKLCVSLDGSQIVVGDSAGRIFIVDVATRMIKRSLKSAVGPVSQISLVSMIDEKVNSRKVKDKNLIRTIPTLKRVAADKSTIDDHVIITRLGTLPREQNKFDLNSFIDKASKEQYWFGKVELSEPEVVEVGGFDESGTSEEEEQSTGAQKQVKKLKDQLKQMGSAYKLVKDKYEDLYKEHASMIS